MTPVWVVRLRLLRPPELLPGRKVNASAAHSAAQAQHGDTMAPKPPHPKTPDGHYIVVRGRLWRCTNPHLSDAERDRLVRELMAARRGVRDARGDAEAIRAARHRVNAAKVALGERGAAWWDGPTHDRCMAVNTPYRDWYLSLPATEG